MWTPTPPLAGWRTPGPGPVLVCVCSSVLASSGGPASLARSGAPDLFLWPLCFSALLANPGWACPFPGHFFALCPPSVFLVSFLSCCFPRAPLSLAFFAFRPRMPWGFALGVVCFVGLALLSSPCAFASFVLPAWPLAALWWFPPPLLCLAVFVAAARCLAFSFFILFLFFFSPVCAPVVSGHLSIPASGALGLGAVLCVFFLPLPSRLSACRVRSLLFCVSRLAVGCSLFIQCPSN